MSNVEPNTGPCAPWAEIGDITEADTSTLDQGILETCLMAATDILFRLSGSRWPGSCTDTVRPNARIVATDHGRPIYPTWPYVLGYGGVGYWSGGYSGAGSGWPLRGFTSNQEELPDGTLFPAIGLGVYPLTGIIEVLEDGMPVDPTTYRIDDNRWLVRIINPAEQPGIPGLQQSNPGWRTTQRMDLPVTEVGTWQVSFRYGTPPPPAGVLACAELAYQLYLGSSPATVGQCRLPQRVTSITRAGTTAVVLDPMAFIDKGRTGLVRCDYFLGAVNPGGLRRRARVTNPDIGRRVRRTGAPGVPGS